VTGRERRKTSLSPKGATERKSGVKKKREVRQKSSWQRILCCNRTKNVEGENGKGAPS